MAKRSTKTAPRKRSPWNNREFLLAVAGYLTTRKLPLIFGADYECSGIADIIGKIADANGLANVRGNWNKIQIPDGLEGITNVPEPGPKPSQPAYNEKAVRANPVAIILDILRGFNLSEQNDIFHSLSKQLQEDRKAHLDKLLVAGKQLHEEHEQARKVLEEFLSIVK